MHFFTLLTLFAASALAQSASDLTVSTPPSLTTCQPILLNWNGGMAPYFVSIIPGGQASAMPLVNFGQISATSYTWNVNIAAGTSVSVKVTDSSGRDQYSSPISINAGSSTSCVGQSASGEAGAIAPATTGADSTGASAPTSTAANQGSPSSSNATSAASASNGNSAGASQTRSSSAPLSHLASSASASASMSAMSATGSNITTKSSAVVNAGANLAFLGFVGAAAAVLIA